MRLSVVKHVLQSLIFGAPAPSGKTLAIPEADAGDLSKYRYHFLNFRLEEEETTLSPCTFYRIFQCVIILQAKNDLFRTVTSALKNI